MYSADDDFTELANPAERLEELLTRVRSKDHKKRALRRIPLTLGPGLELGVGVYTLVRPCYNPQLSSYPGTPMKNSKLTPRPILGKLVRC